MIRPSRSDDGIIEPPRSGPTLPRRVTGAAVGLLCAVMVVAGCGGDDGPPLSAAGEQGRQVAYEKGCLSCHGTNGQGGVGPKWHGLAGSEVELDDGTVVSADDEYLRQSILKPDASQVAGYKVSMPSVDLDPAEVDAVLAYIHDLKDVQ